jgi:hypothetical protein
MFKEAIVSPAQPRRAETRLSAGSPAVSEETREVYATLRVNRSRFAWILANGETASGLSLFALDLLHLDPLHDEERNGYPGNG